MDFLEQRHYRVAPVTVDYADYSFAGVLPRSQRLAGNNDVADKIKDAYLNQIDVGFEYAEKASAELFGSEIPQILLIHCNELNAITLPETIARVRRRGYEFITLDEAMKDPVYQRPDSFAGSGRLVALAHRDPDREAPDGDQRACAGVDYRIIGSVPIDSWMCPSEPPSRSRAPVSRVC